MRAIAIIATLDTKGDQVEYLKRLIEDDGHSTIVIDAGVLGEPFFQPTVSRHRVAQAAGKSLEDIIKLNYELHAVAEMTEGVCKVVKELYSNDKLNGVLAVGGSMGTSLALEVMKVIPIGIPKLIISTIAYSPAINPDMLSSDAMMLPWVGGLWGINSLSKQVLNTAAGAISGAAKAYDKKQGIPKKLVAVTSLGGVVNRYMIQLKPALEERGYEVAAFHATGMSGRILEQLVHDGAIAAVLDLSVGLELLNLVTGSAFSAGEHRLEAAGKMGIPQIVSPGLISRFHWGADKPLPAKYLRRPQPRPHNYLLNAIQANTKEQAAVGKLMAEKLNLSTGPTAVIIPLKRFQPVKGFHHPIIEKSIWDPDAGLRAFRKALNRHLKPEVRVIELEDASIDDPQYTSTVLRLFDELMDNMPET